MIKKKMGAAMVLRPRFAMGKLPFGTVSQPRNGKILCPVVTAPILANIPDAVTHD